MKLVPVSIHDKANTDKPSSNVFAVANLSCGQTCRKMVPPVADAPREFARRLLGLPER